MEDLFDTMTRLENLKTLARKTQKKKSSGSKRNTAYRGDEPVIGGLDFDSRHSGIPSFYDIDSALASRQSGSLSVIDLDSTGFLFDDGIGID
jgi:hypothetical protein